MSLLDVTIVGVFIVYAVWTGFRSKSQASKNLEEYFLAGRSLPWWKAGTSMAATQFAADTPLLVTGLIATSGIFALWQLWIYALAFLLMGFVLAPCWRRVKVLTDAELTEIRYGQKPAAVLRGVKAVYFGTIFNCTVLAWVFFAAAKVAEPFLLWDQWLLTGVFEPFRIFVEWVGVPVNIGGAQAPDVWVKTANNFISINLIVVMTLFYSATGGLRSVVATDVVQFVIMMVGTAIFAGVVVSHVGGWSALGTLVQERFAAGNGPGGISANEILAFVPSQARDASGALLAVFALQWLIQLNSDGTGYLAQRSMACRTEKDAKLAGLLFTFLQVFLRSLLWIPIGLGLLLLFPHDPSLLGAALQADRESTFVRGISELLPAGVKGLMITGMLAALASTVDTHLNWGSSYWTNDLYKRFYCRWRGVKPTERSLVRVARGANVLLVILALFIMTQLESIQQAWQTSLILGAGMGVVLVLRWLWWRMNAWAEVAAILATAALAPILLLYVDSQAWRLLWVALVSTLAALIAIYWAGPEKLQRLKDFYRRAAPPGFWGPVAGSRRKTDVRRLYRSLGATFSAAACIFCLLVSVGSILVSAPPPLWFAGGTFLWSGLLFLAALALGPVWYRLGFR